MVAPLWVDPGQERRASQRWGPPGRGSSPAMCEYGVAHPARVKVRLDVVASHRGQ